MQTPYVGFAYVHEPPGCHRRVGSSLLPPESLDKLGPLHERHGTLLADVTLTGVHMDQQHPDRSATWQSSATCPRHEGKFFGLPGNACTLLTTLFAYPRYFQFDVHKPPAPRRAARIQRMNRRGVVLRAAQRGALE